MRTNIVIDDELMEAAMKAGGFRTKKDAVEEGLRLLARRAAYQHLRALRGKLQWDVGGDWSSGAEQAEKAGHLVPKPRRSYGAAATESAKPVKPVKSAKP